MTRLAAHVLVSALLRRVQNEGGFGAVLHKGDDTGGIILVQTLDRGQSGPLFERMLDGNGRYQLVEIGSAYGGDPEGMTQYLEKRFRGDPDLWLVELDVPEAERLIAEILL